MIIDDRIYMGINETDPLANTPLMMAADMKNKKVL
jgi:hypothetical protein